MAFQFTPLREGRHRKKMRKRALHDFNSRPSARGDGLQCGIILSGQTFQFTPLREGRRAQYWFPVPEVFQFTPLREGRHVPVGLRLTARIFQFTPLREGRPSRTGANPGAEAISIHAPPRGATRSADAARHTPNFNSRPSARGDRYRAASYSARKISIHAPPRGATVWLDEEPLDWPFQFTPLREGRRQPGGKRRNTHDFNSRPSARGDKSPGRTPGGSHISIHAPPRGATHPRETFPASRLFQFTPLREGRRQRNHKVSERFNFNSRPSARGDLKCLITGCAHLAISIHAPPRGATHRICPWLAKKLISIHAAPRGATAPIGADGRLVDISIHAPPRGAT